MHDLVLAFCECAKLAFCWIERDGQQGFGCMRVGCGLDLGWTVWTGWKPECGHGKCQADVLQIATMYVIVIIIIIAVTFLIITTNTIILVIFTVINYLIIVILINLRAMLAMQ